jgi:uncharacterized protein YukE
VTPRPAFASRSFYIPHKPAFAFSPGRQAITIDGMSSAHVDPSELRRFASDLNRFNNELQQLLGGIHGKMRMLENTWRDQEQKKFAESFAATAKMIGNFLEASHVHVQFLNKKAGIVEDYLKQK